MMTYRTIFTVILTLIYSLLNAQNEVKGSIEDASTKEKLAFAHITINNTKTKGAISDIDGNFNLQFKDSIYSIEISYLGFKTISIDGPFPPFLTIQLEPSDEKLAEVFISNKEVENPALAIIRKVIKHKDKNNPEKIGGFKYTSYSKSIFNDENIQQKRDSVRQAYYNKLATDMDFKDTLSAMERAIKNGEMYLFIMESVSERKFLPPNRSFEEIIATKVSGFKNPYFAVLATEIQPFGFYQEHITLLDLHFLNPIANGSINRYDYILEDSIEDEDETIHIISYAPKKGRNFDGLKGFMHVHTSNYALQNIVAEPVDEMMIQLKIQQKYAQLENSVWFPSQLNFEMGFNSGIKVEGKTYIEDVEFLNNLRPSDFSEIKLAYTKDAPKKDDIFWSKYRRNPLSEFEENTYFLIDSLGEEFKFDRILSFGTKLSTGMVQFNKFDFPINRLINYNRFEGFRLGGGLYTNEKIHEKLRLGGYFAYGFRDSQWKYGGDFRWEINRNKDMYFQLFYTHDIREIGTHGMKRKINFGGDLREFIASEMDFTTQYKASFKWRSFKFLSTETNLLTEVIYPQYTYAFFQGQNILTNYTNTELQVKFSYAYGEQLMDNFTQRVSLGTKFPIFHLDYNRGFAGVLGSDFSYSKVEASITQTFFTKQVGRTRYRLQGGYIDQNLPIGLLFTGEGSYDQDIPIVMNDAFQTMLPYEFVSDRYVHLFLTHDVGGLLFKSKNFQPGVILHHNMGWGDLREGFSHSIPFRTKDKVFIESGIELTKLLKINYLDTYYLGFGVGGFYRYGEYALNRSKDNFVTKINMTFSFN